MDKYIKETKKMVDGMINKKAQDTNAPEAPTRSSRDKEYTSYKEKKKIVKRSTMAAPAFYVKLVKGIIYFFQGTFITIKTKEMQKTLFSMVKTLLLSILATYCIIYCVTLPVKFLFHLLTHVGIHLDTFIDQVLTPSNLLVNIAMFLPLVLIGILRYVLPSFNDDMFFTVMTELDPKLSSFIKDSKIRKVYPIWGYVKRLVKLGLMGLFIYVSSFIPVVSNLVYAFSQFYYSYQPLGLGISSVLAILSVFDRYRDPSIYVLKMMMAAHSMGKELLEVYFARVPSVDDEFYLYRRFFGTIFGFSMCWMLALKEISYVGIALWPIAQGSTALLLLKLLERNQWKYENGDSTFVLFGQHKTTSFLKSDQKESLNEKLE